MHFIVHYAYAQGLSEIDLLGDTEPWKEEWTETNRPHDWLFCLFRTAGTARGCYYPLKFPAGAGGENEPALSRI